MNTQSVIGRLPHRYFVTRGSGTGKSPLVAFDSALRTAGIADYNLLRVSSILPAGAEPYDMVDLPGGSLLPCVYSIAQVGPDDPPLVAAVAVAIPAVDNRVGVIMEWHGQGDEAYARAMVQDMAQEAMMIRNTPVERIITAVATTLQIREGYSCAVAAVALW